MEQAVNIKELKVTRVPVGPWDRWGPQVYVVVEVKEPVTVLRGSGYYIDGRLYEGGEGGFTIEPGVYSGADGPFALPPLPKFFDPIFGHELELRMVTDKGTFSKKTKFYMLHERFAQIGVFTTAGLVGAYVLSRRRSTSSRH